MSTPILVVGTLHDLDRAFLSSSPLHSLLGEVQDETQLRSFLEAANEPLNVVVCAHFDCVEALLEQDQPLIRQKVTRLFLIGGKAEPHLPIDPRLKERHPEHFETEPDPAFATLLTSGEGVIWLPADLCLWRHWDETTQTAHLLSALPAFCLATLPEPLPWLRLFRALPAKLAVDDAGSVTELDPTSKEPNAYVVAAIDGGALSRFLTANTIS